MAVTDTRSMMKLPHSLEISIFARELLSDFPERSWTIYLVCSGTGKKSSELILLDPFSLIDYKEVQWYMEDFALRDPFASNRALRIAQSLDRYGKSLVASFLPCIREVTISQEENSSNDALGALQLLIFGDGTMNSLHSLRWELTERAECCQPFSSITVSRMPQVALPLQCGMINIRNPLHILYVSARPAIDEDVSYRIISREILELIETNGQYSPNVSVEFVRPSTWKRFKHVLKARGYGYFDIVHFDMHGTVEKRSGKDKAFLHFSSQGAASKKPELKSSQQIARELAENGVRSVILNACNGATAGFSNDSNLAYVIASHGIRFVVALAYEVKTDAATLFMQKLYSMFFATRNILIAVKYARAELRLNRERTGRYGMTVQCDDDCNLVCYVAKSDFDISKDGDSPALADAILVAAASLDSSLHPALKFEKETTRHGPRTVRRIQDLDILSIEELLVGNDVVFITGESGTGKSTLARQMQAWWKRTKFARTIEYFESPPDIDNWLESLHNTESSENLSTRQATSSIEEPRIELNSYDYDQMLLLDNVESWDTVLEKEAKKDQPSRMLNLIKQCQESLGRNRILFFTRMAEDILSSQFPGKIVHEISIPAVEEAAALAKSYLSEQTMSSQLDNADLEELIKTHRMNLSFLHLFIPRMAQLDIRPRNFISYLLENPQASNFEEFHDYIGAEGSATHVFKLIHDQVQTWSQAHVLSFRMFFPFCMFQCRFPQDVRYWLDKLYEKGLFSGGKPSLEPFPAESGKIHCYDLKGWESFPKDWEFESSWLRVKHYLEIGGLIQKARKTTSAAEPYFRVHPLLPYFLRYEIARLPLRDPQKYWSYLCQAYWEYYEVRANSLTLSFLQNPSDRSSYQLLINDDMVNLQEAVKFSTEQICFPFRIMRVYNLLPYLNFVAMTQGQLRRWAYLLDRVLARFERIHSERQWSETPPQDTKQSMLLYLIQIAESLGEIFANSMMPTALIENAERALKLKAAFEQDFAITSNISINAALYKIQVGRAKAIPASQWTSTDLDFFEEFLVAKVPDGLQANGGRMKVAKAELANHLAHEKTNIPTSHPLHAILEDSFREGLTFIQSIFLDNPTSLELLSLAGRNAITFSAKQEPGTATSLLDVYASEQNVLQIYHNIQKGFLARMPANSPSYSADARAYTVDIEALQRQDQFVYDRMRLRQVYEISQQQRDLINQIFCLEQLSNAAAIDGDFTAARNYLAAWEMIDQNQLRAGQLAEKEGTFRKTRREIILKKIENGGQKSGT